MKPRSIHAPARRIIRTLVALGPEHGSVLVSDAIKAITSMVDGCGADICGMAYWWSNCVQMRFMLANVSAMYTLEPNSTGACSSDIMRIIVHLCFLIFGSPTISSQV